MDKHTTQVLISAIRDEWWLRKDVVGCRVVCQNDEVVEQDSFDSVIEWMIGENQRSSV